jgi:uncharacterized alpha-E superfamily protein
MRLPPQRRTALSAVAPDNPNALVSCIRNARLAARGVRQSISSEMGQLNTPTCRWPNRT